MLLTNGINIRFITHIIRFWNGSAHLARPTGDLSQFALLCAAKFTALAQKIHAQLGNYNNTADAGAACNYLHSSLPESE
jgi:hypothetical protein